MENKVKYISSEDPRSILGRVFALKSNDFVELEEVY